MVLFIVMIFLLACTKRVGMPPQSPSPAPLDIACQTPAIPSFSADVLPIFQNNCNGCHAKPGSGGINLDQYSSISQQLLGGELMPVVTNTDVNSTIMPPPPQRHLDSCDLKTLSKWLGQSCLNN
jgi:hypothetical protein